MHLRPSFLVVAFLSLPAVAHAEGSPSLLDARVAREGEKRMYLRPFATLGSGIGLRFNNPFRLATPLGENAESVSLTAAYMSVGGGVALGDPLGFQHGPVLRWDFALQGVGQHVLVPSYAGFRRGALFGGWARFGLPVLLTPDQNVGMELAVGGAWYARAGVGLTAELLGDLFWGVGTPDNKRPMYPVLSGQLGVVVEWEQLP